MTPSHRLGQAEKTVNSLNNNNNNNNNNNTNQPVQHNNVINNETTSKYISVPYIRGTSERVARIFKPHGIKIGHKPTNTIKTQLFNAKDKRPTLEKTGAIYKIKCSNCNIEYIGETGGELSKRIHEHKNAVQRKDPLSAIYNHINTTGHQMDWDGTTIINQHSNNTQRKLLEAMHSHNNTNTINRTIILPQQYIPTINSILN